MSFFVMVLVPWAVCSGLVLIAVAAVIAIGMWSAEYDARDRKSKVILAMIVTPWVVWFLTWLVSRFF